MIIKNNDNEINFTFYKILISIDFMLQLLNNVIKFADLIQIQSIYCVDINYI